MKSIVITGKKDMDIVRHALGRAHSYDIQNYRDGLADLTEESRLAINLVGKSKEVSTEISNIIHYLTMLELSTAELRLLDAEGTKGDIDYAKNEVKKWKERIIGMLEHV